eukprot:2942240-Pyramimonas_sp.AAC.1
MSPLEIPEGILTLAFASRFAYPQLLTFTIVWIMAQLNFSYSAGAILIYLYFANLIPQRVRREADERTVAGDVELLNQHRVDAESRPKTAPDKKETKKERKKAINKDQEDFVHEETAEWVNTLLVYHESRTTNHVPKYVTLGCEVAVSTNRALQ